MARRSGPATFSFFKFRMRFNQADGLEVGPNAVGLYLARFVGPEFIRGPLSLYPIEALEGNVSVTFLGSPRSFKSPLQ